MVTLCFEENVIDGERTHAWALVTPWQPFESSDHFSTRAQMLSNCVDVLGETLLQPELEFHKDIHKNTKNLLISAARTRTRLKVKVAVTENFHDRGHGDMTGIVGIPYHSNSGGEE